MEHGTERKGKKGREISEKRKGMMPAVRSEADLWEVTANTLSVRIPPVIGSERVEHPFLWFWAMAQRSKTQHPGSPEPRKPPSACSIPQLNATYCSLFIFLRNCFISLVKWLLSILLNHMKSEKCLLGHPPRSIHKKPRDTKADEKKWRWLHSCFLM